MSCTLNWSEWGGAPVSTSTNLRCPFLGMRRPPHNTIAGAVIILQMALSSARLALTARIQRRSLRVWIRPWATSFAPDYRPGGHRDEANVEFLREKRRGSPLQGPA